ncbi:hypothetical protein [Bradyrhizobium sp. ORS 111]|uniref:hypothetical protein n=1 Tax=Bradyrhizobium sp. ORS 111 TaxID=1685958 RepID=UPI00388EC1BE
MYVPDWEPIGVALKRLIAIGLHEDEAMADLCNAVADQKIELRAVVGGDDYYAGVTVQRSAVEPPPRLTPADIDWTNSRPLSPWSCGRSLEEKERPLDLLELSTQDVEILFPGATKVVVRKGTTDDFRAGKNKGGRPPEYDWDEVKAFCFQVVEERGRPGKENRRLPSIAQLVEAILDHWNEAKGIELAEVTVRKRVNTWLSEV